jgi:hypothetical protein
MIAVIKLLLSHLSPSINAPKMKNMMTAELIVEKIAKKFMNQTLFAAQSARAAVFVEKDSSGIALEFVSRKKIAN